MGKKISVLLLTQNSEKFIKRCLDSLARFEEIILVDGGSTDNTLEIASRYSNVIIYENRWPGFIVQRNFSIEKASYEWCFMLDSDEMVTAELTSEIYYTVNNNPEKILYNVYRTEFYLGEEVVAGHGKSWWQERLFLKNRVCYTGGNHHEHLIDGESISLHQEKIGFINSRFRVLHDETYCLEDWIKKIPRFSLLIANEKFEKGKRVGVVEVLLTLYWTFIHMFSKSWRLGKVGFIISIQTAIFRALAKLILYEKSHVNFQGREKTDSIDRNFLG